MNFITPSDVKSQTVIPAGIDNYLFENDIAYTQTRIIEPLLGKSLSTWLKARLALNSTAPEVTALFGQLLPAHCWHTLSHALPFMHIQLSASGLVVPHGATGNAAGLTGLNLLQAQAEERAQFYTRVLLKYLQENVAAYPNWKPEESVLKGFGFGLYVPQ